MKNTTLLATAFAITASAGAQAQIHAGDIAIGLVGNQIAVSDDTRDDNGDLVFGTNVFGVMLDQFARSTNPGFDSNNDVFASNAQIGYQHTAALRRWNGSDFETIPAERLRISLGPSAGVSTPLQDGEVLSGPTVTVGSDGEFHHHYAFRLELNGQRATDPQSHGVYLATLRLFDDSGIHETSEDFWLLLDNSADLNDFLDAEQYARDTLLTTTPVCLADTNEDGTLNGADFNAWLAAFAQESPIADQNQDGILNGADFNAWLANFAGGCD